MHDPLFVFIATPIKGKRSPNKQSVPDGLQYYFYATVNEVSKIELKKGGHTGRQVLLVHPPNIDEVDLP
ncbi:hypothetical protein [Saccharospirillum salsuginis]|uniref:hypothetical protein n=1 Tax=Saccharospirillum salsuginis TaxID=418750 RepID=UPI00167A8741|nr:hypothetical protein [Saccharospirillum salsuginis]